jgi:hypothetical protein
LPLHVVEVVIEGGMAVLFVRAERTKSLKGAQGAITDDDRGLPAA